MKTLKPLQIGGIRPGVPFLQASLAGYSDMPMRQLARRFGCPLTLTPVMLDRIAVHKKAIQRFKPFDNEYPIGAQIIGRTAETMAEAAENFIRSGYDLIDLNFACPAPKVLRRGRGGALLKHPRQALEIYRQVRDRVTVPVMVKLRAGFDNSGASREDFFALCEGLAELPPDAVVIHGRTVTQKYRDKADWGIIKQVKKNHPEMTVIGSGDVFDIAGTVRRCLSAGLDGFLVARGAIGNPWIIGEAAAICDNQPIPKPPALAEVGEVMLEHFELMLTIKPPRKTVPYFRKFAAGYCKRHPKRKQALLDLLAAKTAEQVRAKISKWFLEY